MFDNIQSIERERRKEEKRQINTIGDECHEVEEEGEREKAVQSHETTMKEKAAPDANPHVIENAIILPASWRCALVFTN